MKDPEEDHKPEVRARNSNTKGVDQDAEVVSVLEVDHTLLADGDDVLIKKVKDTEDREQDLDNASKDLNPIPLWS
jgi:hypothetical protein